jgi:protoporphyrinogen oxidase
MNATVLAAIEPQSGRAERVGVVGGGMLGMTIALRLRQAGFDVEVIEAAPVLGGLADAWTVADVTWDRHYHVTLLSDSATRGILRELGLEDDLAWTTTETGFYTDGGFHSMSNIIEFLQFPALNLIDKFRLGMTILYASRIKDGRPLERVTVESWLTKFSGKRTFAKIWRPLLRAKLGERYTETSASFIWAIIARLYAARRSGIGQERFGYLPGGYGRTISAFAQRLHALGVRMTLGTRVTSIVAGGNERVLKTADGDERRYDRVVVTLASPIAAALCDDIDAEQARRLRAKTYQGIVCASLVLDEPLGPYYISNLTDDWVPFSAVIDMSAIVDRKEFGGKALVYLPKYCSPDDPLFERSDDEIRASFCAALARMYPDFAKRTIYGFRVSRVRHVFPIATLNYSDELPAMRSSVPGIWFVNSTQILNGTLNVNETIGLAERAASEIEREVLR